jgi:thioredoxin-related protein
MKSATRFSRNGLLSALLCLLVTLLLAACDKEPPMPVIEQPAAEEQVQSPAEPAVPEQADSEAAEVLAAGMVNPGYQEKPDWFANSFLDIREDIGEAQSAGKRVLLYFYQDGCPYCKKLLETNFSLADTVTRTREHFEVIAINMWGDREVTDLSGTQTTEKEFARALRVMFTPTLLFLDEQGNVVLRVNGYYPPHRFNAALDYAAEHDGKSPTFLEYLAQVAPVPSTGKLHGDPSFLPAGNDLSNRYNGRPLLVMFEQQDCAPCDELHQDILQRPESKELLKRFDVVVLDLWSKEPVNRPDGSYGSVADWARKLDVKYAPSLVFFDEDNREVFRAEAYLKAFHTQSSMDYVASKAYLDEPEFQRYIAGRAEVLEGQGVHVELME